MEDTKKRPLLPANYVSFLDLRERWMKQQQQNKRDEENPQKELQRHSEVQIGRAEAEREEKSEGVNHQLDENSVVHLNPNPNDAIRRPLNGNRRPGEEGNYRWVEVSKAKSLDVFPSKQTVAPPIEASQSEPAPVAQVRTMPLSPMLRVEKSKPRPSSEVPKIEAASKAPGEIHGSDNKAIDRKLNNENAKKPSVRNERPGEKEELAQSRLNKGVSSTKDDQEKENAKIQEKPKTLPVLQAYRCKPPLSELDRGKTAVQAPGEVHDPDKEVSYFNRNKRKGNKANARNRKINQQEILVKSQPNKGVFALKADLEKKANVKLQLEPKAPPVLLSNPPPFEALKIDPAVLPPTHRSEEVVNVPKHDKAKKKKSFKKRNQKFKNDVKDKGNPEQEAEAVRETKDANDSSRAETEGKLAGLSLANAPGESCSRGSIVAKNRKGWRKDGSYGKFERRAMLKTERARCEGCLVWIKKEESSQIAAAKVENACNIRD